MQVPQYDETRSSLFNEILAAGKARYPNEHPWQQLFLEGKLSQDQLKVWAQNRYYFHAGIPAKDANVFCKLPDDKDAKGMWLEKLQEEMGNDEEQSHPDMFIDFCEGLGLTRDEVTNAKVFAPIKIGVDAYTNACRVKPFQFGVGASISEYTVPFKMTRMLKAFNEHYSFIPEKALHFFSAHKEADEVHGGIMINLIEKYGVTDSDKASLQEGYMFKLDLHRIILDTIHYETVLKQ